MVIIPHSASNPARATTDPSIGDTHVEDPVHFAVRGAPQTGEVAMPVGLCVCGQCGAIGQTLDVTLRQSAGFLVASFSQSHSGHLCKACIYEKGLRYQAVTFVLGWWGAFSLLYSLVALPMNLIAMTRASRLVDAPGRPSSPSSLIGAVLVTVATVAFLGALAILIASPRSPW